MNIKADINDPDVAQAMRLNELSKYTTNELKDELRSREQVIDPPSSDVCEHNFEMGYCVVEKCEGGI